LEKAVEGPEVMNDASGGWAALFPGQGSQKVGMGQDLAREHAAARRVFEEAGDVLGESLSELCFEGPEEDLRLTRNTQPALLATSVAAWRVVADELPAPAVAAGHSLGEFSALVAAGVLDFADALRAVRVRGEAMQDAVPVGVGAMAAVIGLDGERVADLCDQASTAERVVVPANINAPDQLVVAGHKEAVEQVVESARRAGAKRAVPLPVSAPFHCQLMESAAERLNDFLSGITFHAGRFPVVGNVDAQPAEEAERCRERLVEQVTAPVRWVETQQMIADGLGVGQGVEFGAGRTLAGLARRTVRSLRVVGLGEPEDVGAVREALVLYEPR
jgi:[acyl-carrier-protein] S-malonyltransferase